MNPWTYENLFYLTSDKKRILKLLDHYEVYNKILNIKGDVIECGVFKGVSLIRFLTYRNFYNQNKKTLYGFDAFGRFPKLKDKRDNNFAQKLFFYLILHDNILQLLIM